MTTCRDVLVDALSALGVVTFGSEPTADEVDGGLAAMRRLILDLHDARGPMLQIDVNTDWMATENQRVRVEAGARVVISLPNSILVHQGSQGDFGFASGVSAFGSSGQATPADGLLRRPPRDGSRIEIVGASQGLYFYRADINAWIAANPPLVDGPSPLNSRYDSALAALIAERLCDPFDVSPSPLLTKRIARGKTALMLQSATSRASVLTTFL